MHLTAYRVYLIMCALAPLTMSTIWVCGAVYYVLSVHMNPLQLVLVGTALEVSYFFWQIPTGVFADTRSRRLSVVIGVVITGICWIFQGLFPAFAAIILAETVRGAGEAFIEGAEAAWLSDELGKVHFGQAVVRGSQVGQVAGMVGIFAGVALASSHLYLPIVIGGAVLVAEGMFLAVFMPEEHFRPIQHAHHTTRLQVMRVTLRVGFRGMRGSPVLLAIIAASFIWGLHSEGYDRLWEAHFLKDLTFPRLSHFKTVVWFGIMSFGNAIIYMVGSEIMRRRLDMNDGRVVARALLVMTTITALGIVVFGLAVSFPLALAAFALVSLLKGLIGPVYTTWLNSNIEDSSVRATVLSFGAQANALGQTVGGPGVGLLGTAVFLRAAITATGVLLTPILVLYGWAITGGHGSAAEPEKDPKTLEAIS